MSEIEIGFKWLPMKAMPEGAEDWIGLDYQKHVAEWRELRVRLESRKLDKTIMEIWSQEYRRLFAIETGQLENLYVLRHGVTEELIATGLEGVRQSHTISEELDDNTLQGLLTDQAAALELVFDAVAQRRPLSQSTIKEWHALLTRHQDNATGFRNGKRVPIPLLRGAYKIRLNNPRESNGKLHQYCPPEHTASEMDRLLDMYEEIKAVNYPTEVEAAWLHHRFVATHPFQDGNGRVSRLLMAYAYISRGEFPPIIPSATKLQYYDVLKLADQGDLASFAEYLGNLASTSLLAAIRAARGVLADRDNCYHANGDQSSKANGEKKWKYYKKENGDFGIETQVAD